MTSKDSVLKQYYRDVSKSLPCHRKMKKQIVSQLADSVNQYLEQNPATDFAMVQAHFGTPQEIASGYVEDQDASTLLKKMSIKKKVFAIVAGAVAVILLLWLGAVTWAIVDAEQTTDGHIGVTIDGN